MKTITSSLAAVALSTLALTTMAGVTTAEAQKKFTIALVPGLTTDAFYITMRKGAEAAAKSVGAELTFQGAPDFNPVTQSPVLDAVIARHPDAILIAPTDKTQMVQPLKKAADAGIPVVTVDTFIGTGDYQTGSRATPISRCPTSRPTTCSAARWRRARSPRRSATKARSTSRT